MKKALIPVCLFACPVTALAGDNAPETRLEEVVIIGQAEAAREKTGSAHVVEPEQLEEFSHTDINRMLREVPGVYLREEEGYGLRPNIGIRGSGSQRSSKISLMEDGVLMAPAPYADPAAYYFPTAGRMHALEVLKGPETLKYGPFSVGGALNMVSTPIPQDSGGRVQVEGGDYGEKRLVASYGQREEQVGWLLETVQHNTDGFQDIDRSHEETGFSIEDYVGKLRLNTGADARYYQQLDLKLQYSEENSAMSYLGLTDADFSADPDRRYGLSALDEMANRHVAGNVRYRFELNEQLAVNALLYGNDFKRDWFKLDRIDGQSLSSVINNINHKNAGWEVLQGQLNGTQDINNVDYKHNNRQYDAWGTQLTLDARFDTGSLMHNVEVGMRRHYDDIDRYQPVERFNQRNGQLVFASYIEPNGSNNRKAEAEATSFWVMDRITAGSVTLLPILRYEDIRTEEKQWADSLRVVVPTVTENHVGGATQLGLGATWDINDQWQLLAGVHEGFAPPGASAVEGTEAEESLNTELGVRFKRDAFNAEAIYFRSDYENTVRNCSVASPCTGGVDFGTESLGESEINGLELALGYEWAGDGNWVVPVRMAYTYTDGEITKDSDTGAFLEGDNLPDLPPQLWSASVGVVHGQGWDSYLTLSYVDELCVDTTCDRSGVDDRFLKTEDLLVVDWTAGYHLADGLRVYTKVNNLFDEQEIVSRRPDGARPNLPRTLYAGVSWEF